MTDLICNPTPGSPGQWTITAGTERGRSWWASTNRPRLDEHLGDTTFCQLDVDQLVREGHAADLLVAVDGFVAGSATAWCTRGGGER